MRIKDAGFWLAVFSIITLIFSPAIIYPFFQDDFFALVTTKVSSSSDIWRLFLPVAEAVYWRPLGIQLYFGLMQFLGLGKPIWFHLISLSVHLLNTYLVYKLILGKLVVRQERIAKLTAFLWGTSPIHYFALGWAVNFSFILAATWAILAVLAAIDGRNFKATLFFGLGLMTNEMAIVIPALVFLAAGGKRQRLAGIMAAISAGYVGWRWISGVKIQGEYGLNFAATVSTLRWYGLWILGWSDIVRDFIRWGVVFTGDFIKTFPAAALVYTIELPAIVILLIRTGKRIFWRGLVWMLVGLLPVMFFSKHLYSHYGAVAAIGIYWLTAEAVNRRQWMAAAIIWLMVTMTTLGLNYQASWMADHARNSLKYQAKIRQYADIQAPEEIIYIVSGDREAKIVLLNGWGPAYLLGVSREDVKFVSSVNEIPDTEDKRNIIFL